MSKKKIYFNVICILLLFINFYFAGLILGRIGIIRDEYGITGRDNIISFSNEIIIFYLPIVIIISNIISLIFKNMKKQIYVFISLLSAIVIIVSSILNIKIRYDIKHYQPGYIEMNETAGFACDMYVKVCFLIHK